MIEANSISNVIESSSVIQKKAIKGAFSKNSITFELQFRQKLYHWATETLEHPEEEAGLHSEGGGLPSGGEVKMNFTAEPPRVSLQRR